MRFVAWGALACAFALGACKKESTASEVAPDLAASASASASATGPAVLAPASAMPPPARPPTQVKLLAAGSEPRRVLRYHPAVGLKEVMTATLSIPKIEMTMAGQKMPPQKMPATTMDIETAVVEKEADGDVRYTFKLGQVSVAKAPGVDAKVTKMLERAYDALGSFNGSGVISPRGFNLDLKVELPPSVPPELQQSVQGVEQAVRQISAPLPDEAVGAGARWESTASITAAQVDLRQTATYELVTATENGFRAKVRVVQSAPKQTLTQQGVSVEITSIESTGEGAIEVELAKLVPKKSSMDVTTITRASAEGQETLVETQMVVEMRGR